MGDETDYCCAKFVQRGTNDVEKQQQNASRFIMASSQRQVFVCCCFLGVN